jgi:hypothetical protein
VSKLVLFGILYFFIVSFIVFVLIIHNAPEYIEREDGSLIPKPRKKKAKD